MGRSCQKCRGDSRKTLTDLRIAEITKLDMKVENSKEAAYRARVYLAYKYVEATYVMSTTPEQIRIFRSGLRPENSIYCGFAETAECDDVCLEPGKIEVLKMLDLETKSAIDSDNLQVRH